MAGLLGPRFGTACQVGQLGRASTNTGRSLLQSLWVILNWLQPKFAAKSVANEMQCLNAIYGLHGLRVEVVGWVMSDEGWGMRDEGMDEVEGQGLRIKILFQEHLVTMCLFEGLGLRVEGWGLRLEAWGLRLEAWGLGARSTVTNRLWEGGREWEGGTHVPVCKNEQDRDRDWEREKERGGKEGGEGGRANTYQTCKYPRGKTSTSVVSSRWNTSIYVLIHTLANSYQFIPNTRHNTMYCAYIAMCASNVRSTRVWIKEFNTCQYLQIIYQYMTNNYHWASPERKTAGHYILNTYQAIPTHTKLYTNINMRFKLYENIPCWYALHVLVYNGR